MNRIEHPGVVSVEDAGSQGDIGLYMVQELVQGESLRQRLDSQGTLDVEVTAALLRKSAMVLQAAHEAGVLHRNLRPGNLMLVADEEVEGGERVRILGFSVAKLMDTGEMGENTATGVALGDFRYISPEQCLDSKSATEASDVYALGVIAYRMLGGKLPHEAKSLTQMVLKHHQAKVTDLVELNPEVPQALAQGLPGVGQTSAEQHIAHGGQREDIGARINALGVEALLWGHVLGGADDHAGGRQLAHGVIIAQQLGHAEVEHLDRHAALDGWMLTHEHRAHATLTETLDQLIMANRLVD